MTITIPERLARMDLATLIEPGDRHIGAILAEHEPLAVRNRIIALRSRFDESADSGLDEPWSTWVRRSRQVSLDDVHRRTDELGLDYLVPGDAHWPVQLDELDRVAAAGITADDPLDDIVVAGDPIAGTPLGLWVRGEAAQLPKLGGNGVTVTGSRAATAYGEQVAVDIAGSLAGHNPSWSVVGGLGYGIEAAAHRSALAEGAGPRVLAEDRLAPTVGVLASGLDQVYPRSHRPLIDRIAAEGAAITELPPGSHPTRSHVIARTRLLAALSCATVLVEASVRSSSLPVVRTASRLGRPVLAVPGPITSPTSLMPNRLIAEQRATGIVHPDTVIDTIIALEDAEFDDRVPN